jgi:hypothetical protein
MSARRFFREVVVFVGVAGGTVIGYCAGAGLPDGLHSACAFGGMALGWAAVDFCLQQKGR